MEAVELRGQRLIFRYSLQVRRQGQCRIVIVMEVVGVVMVVMVVMMIKGRYSEVW